MGSRTTCVVAIAGWILLSTTGCGALRSGLLYTHVTKPLDTDFDLTPVHEGASTNSHDSLRYYVRVDWGSTGLGDVAKRLGFKKIHYADLETLSVLGIWTQQTAHIYGER